MLCATGHRQPAVRESGANRGVWCATLYNKRRRRHERGYRPTASPVSPHMFKCKCCETLVRSDLFGLSRYLCRRRGRYRALAVVHCPRQWTMLSCDSCQHATVEFQRCPRPARRVLLSAWCHVSPVARWPATLRRPGAAGSHNPTFYDGGTCWAYRPSTDAALP